MEDRAMNADVIKTARALIAGDKGLLAMDESTATCNRRFAAFGITQTEEMRRKYRELIITTPGLAKSISGVILTVSSLLRVVPAAVPGIAFLSGGQSPELASARLNAMIVSFKNAKSQPPWALTFSFARAIPQPALELWRELWRGEDANLLAAQQALLLRARCNQAARRGEYSEAMEIS